MALTTLAAAVAGTAAASAYMDAKYHVRHDLYAVPKTGNAAKAAAYMFLEGRVLQDRMLVYHDLETHALSDRGSYLFLEFEGRSWTYRAFYDEVQKVGNWLMNELGVQRDEIVALNGPNSAEYLMLLFALNAVGAVASFINCNLTGNALEHCVKVVEARFLISDRSIEYLVEPCSHEIGNYGGAIRYYDQAFFESLNDSHPIPQSRRSSLEPMSLRSLIYTSGTTGLPKATMMPTGRILNTAQSMAEYLKLKPGDKMHTCLPLYHGAAQGLCLWPSVYAGSSISLGRKFSHKTFWPEVSASGANILQYVGELCRYLVNAPTHPLERQHNIRMAWGNGMRPDVWEHFRQRFAIRTINELYAATDGMGSMFNPNQGEFTRNAIGLRGLVWRFRNGGAEVRVRMDVDTEEIVRGLDGFAIKCSAGEPGEVLHKVDPEMKAAAFLGYYNNPGSSEKRWMKDVFESGDLWFRSGDVMRQDADGRVFFVDRLGDTFRWRSENVSTNEVSDVLGTFGQIDECNVYGVAVPNADGRCGCAAIVLKNAVTTDNLDLAALSRHVLTSLPRYAVPIFLRITPGLSYTGTFKIQKGVAKREGANWDIIEKSGSNDQLYWLPPGEQCYVPYRREDWRRLENGQVKL